MEDSYVLNEKNQKKFNTFCNRINELDSYCEKYGLIPTMRLCSNEECEKVLDIKANKDSQEKLGAIVTNDTLMDRNEDLLPSYVDKNLSRQELSSEPVMYFFTNPRDLTTILNNIGQREKICIYLMPHKLIDDELHSDGIYPNYSNDEYDSPVEARIEAKHIEDMLKESDSYTQSGDLLAIFDIKKVGGQFFDDNDFVMQKAERNNVTCNNNYNDESGFQDLHEFDITETYDEKAEIEELIITNYAHNMISKEEAIQTINEQNKLYKQSCDNPEEYFDSLVEKYFPELAKEEEQESSNQEKLNKFFSKAEYFNENAFNKLIEKEQTRVM